MRSWNNPDGTPNDKDRIDGMNDFVRKIKLPENSKEPALCKGDPVHAREKFIEWGEFHRADEVPPPPQGAPIPADTVFHFWESNDQLPEIPNDPDRLERDKEVVLVVDTKNVGPEPLGNAQVWRCTYTPYRGIFLADDANPS